MLAWTSPTLPKIVQNDDNPSQCGGGPCDLPFADNGVAPFDKEVSGWIASTLGLGALAASIVRFLPK